MRPAASKPTLISRQGTPHQRYPCLGRLLRAVGPVVRQRLDPRQRVERAGLRLRPTGLEPVTRVSKTRILSIKLRA